MCHGLYAPMKSHQSSPTGLDILRALLTMTRPQLLATTDLFTVSIVLPFSECHIVGNITLVSFTEQYALKVLP